MYRVMVGDMTIEDFEVLESIIVITSINGFTESNFLGDKIDHWESDKYILNYIYSDTLQKNK